MCLCPKGEKFYMASMQTEDGVSSQSMNIMIFNFSLKESTCDYLVTSCFHQTGREVSTFTIKLV